MKKIVTIIALVGALAASSYGQGLISIANSATYPVTARGGDYALTGAPIKANTAATSPTNAFIFGLFVADAGTAAPVGNLDPAWQFVGGYAYNSTSTSASAVGRLLTSTATVTGYGFGSTVNFIMRGWSANLGATWTDVKASLGNANLSIPGYYLGTSALAVNTILGGGAIGTPTAFGSATTQIPGLVLDYVAVPEPSTFALAGIGAAAMLIFRRRK